MEFSNSLFVRSLRTAEQEFLQVLVTKLSLGRSGRGSLLRINFDEGSPTIISPAAKVDVKSWIPEFDKNAKRLQKTLDKFLLERDGRELEIDEPSFPFRFASIGVLPVLHAGDSKHYALFYSDTEPAGWTIVEGATRTRAELMDPTETGHRQLREELLILNLGKPGRYVLQDESKRRVEQPELPSIAAIWKEHFQRFDFPSFQTLNVPLRWDRGPDEVRVLAGDTGTVTVSSCFLTINALDFGIHIDRVAHLHVDAAATLCDGKLMDGRLSNRIVGLFPVDELNDAVLGNDKPGLVEPVRIFRDGGEWDMSKMEDAVEEIVSRTDESRQTSQPRGLTTIRPQAKSGLCPATARIIRRYAERSREPHPESLGS